MDLIEEDRCSQCRSEFTQCNHEITICCPCGYQDTHSLYDAKMTYAGGCPDNGEYEAEFNRSYHNLAAYGSDAAKFYSFRWGRQTQQYKTLLPENMKDYWEYLIHFTSEKAFVEILNSDSILKSPTGRYYKDKLYKEFSKAVCLTETPLEYANRFFDNYGKVGFVFRKSDLQKHGAQPIINLTDKLLKLQKGSGWHNSLIPFIQLIRAKSTGGSGARYDWLHDREWRIPSDIEFSVVEPVGIVFAEPISYRSKGDKVWHAKIEAASRFKEIVLDKR